MANDDWFTGKGDAQPVPASKDKPKGDDWFTGSSGDLPAQLPSSPGVAATGRVIRDIGRGAARTVVSSGDLLRMIFPPEGGPAWTDPVGAGARGLADLATSAPVSSFATSKPETSAGKYLGIAGELGTLFADVPIGITKGLGGLAMRVGGKGLGRAAYEPSEEAITAAGKVISEKSGSSSLSDVASKATEDLSFWKRRPTVEMSPLRKWQAELAGPQGVKRAEELAKSMEEAPELDALEGIAGPELGARVKAKMREPGFFQRALARYPGQADVAGKIGTGALSGAVMPEGPQRKGEAEGALRGAAAGAAAVGATQAIGAIASHMPIRKWVLAYALSEMGLVKFGEAYGVMHLAPYAGKLSPRLVGGEAGQAAGSYLP